MKNETTKFLATIDAKTKNAILDNIAKHYGISRDEAYEEVCDDEAEPLCDYVTGPERAATSLILKKYRFSNK